MILIKHLEQIEKYHKLYASLFQNYVVNYTAGLSDSIVASKLLTEYKHHSSISPCVYTYIIIYIKLYYNIINIILYNNLCVRNICKHLTGPYP